MRDQAALKNNLANKATVKCNNVFNWLLLE